MFGTMSGAKINVAFILVLNFTGGSFAAPVLSSPEPRIPGNQALTPGKTSGALAALKTNGTTKSLQCGVTTQVTSKTDKYELCPTSCPYFAQNREDVDHCTFLCVTADECADWNPNKPIADSMKKTRTCRGPRVEFCDQPQLDGTDACRVCQAGFRLDMATGKCYFKYWWPVGIGTTIIVILVTFVIVWFVDIWNRQTTNPDVLEESLAWRSRSKILKPKNAEGGRQVHSFWTNLCKTDVAGPGMTLHFTFQAFLIGWPLFVALLWTVLACFHNELFILGTRKFGTPRHNCILVAWGYETQQGLMWTKVLFLAVVYIATFVSFLLFSVYQHRLFQKMDAENKTMKDFVVELKGLPALPADNKDVEKDIQRAVEAKTGKTIVGVSIAWNFVEVEDKVMKAVRNEEIPPDGPSPFDRATHPIHARMFEYEKALLGPDEEEMTEIVNQDSVMELFKDMKSSESAFVVFKTEKDKDDALELTKNEGLMFACRNYGEGFPPEVTLSLEPVPSEPMALNWQNFGESGAHLMLARFFKGFGCYYVPAISVWFFVFYVPYAFSLYNFNYENGAEPPAYYGLVFTMVVVGGNATMYVICDLCAEEIRFRYKDTKQCVYLIFYLAACMFNVFLDMVVTWFTAWKIMTGLDFRTYHGTRLEDVDSFTEQFETYAMQRSLAQNTFAYAFPSTFLVPFLLEPIVTVLAPYQVGRMIIRTHPEVRGASAEAYIAAFDFDLGRYADIILNVFLGILIFFFPGGYTWGLFYGMFISHIVIYVFDHWRVLNVIPSVKIVSNTVDWWAQLMLIPCCSMILGCLVFKANCETYTNYCLKDMSLIGSATMAGVAHFIVHTLLFVYLVPILGGTVKDKQADVKYEEIAKIEPKTWFSMNPVHCLRSQYLHKHSPFCQYASIGKEHMLKVNESIGCYFSDTAAATESYGTGAYAGAAKQLSRSLTGMNKE
jgi:hypothetical protein